MSARKKIFLLFLTLSITLFIGLMGSVNKIIVYADSKKIEHWTMADNVEEVIDELDNINLSSDDIIEPDKNTKISSGLTINIIRVKKAECSVLESIPYKVQNNEDSNILAGQKRVINKGQNGIRSKTFLVTYYNGIEKSKKLIKEEILKEPVTEVIALGTRKTVQRAGKNLDYKAVLTMKSTAYTHTGNRTATGVVPKRGTVAVDPKVIPLGSKLYVDGYGFAVAQDIGSSIKGQRIDLFMETKNEALKWGVRTVRVYILN